MEYEAYNYRNLMNHMSAYDDTVCSGPIVEAGSTSFKGNDVFTQLHISILATNLPPTRPKLHTTFEIVNVQQTTRSRASARTPSSDFSSPIPRVEPSNPSGIPKTAISAP